MSTSLLGQSEDVRARWETLGTARNFGKQGQADLREFLKEELPVEILLEIALLPSTLCYRDQILLFLEQPQITPALRWVALKHMGRRETELWAEHTSPMMPSPTEILVSQRVWRCWRRTDTPDFLPVAELLGALTSDQVEILATLLTDQPRWSFLERDDFVRLVETAQRA